MGKASEFMSGNLAKQKALKAALPTLSVENPAELDMWLNKIFTNIKGGVKTYLSRTPAENKLDILQQAATDTNGIGELKIGQNNFVEYVPVDFNKKGPSSGFAKGRTRLGM